MALQHTASAPGSGKTRGIADQILRFAGVGGITFAVGLAVTALSHELLGLPEQVGAGIALAVLLVLGFVLSRTFTFESSGHIGRQAWKFLFVGGLMRGFEYFLFLGLFSGIGLNYLIAFCLALGISFFVKFFLYRNWIFAESSDIARH
jgi:putative flippase GtrA